MISTRQAFASLGLLVLFFVILFSNLAFVGWSGGQKAWGASVAFMSWSVGLSMRDNIKSTFRGLAHRHRAAKINAHRSIALLAFLFALVGGAMFYGASPAHADFFNYPCQQNGQGFGADVKVVVDASGQFCDGPTQINLSHLHCDSGGASVGGGGIGIAPVGAGFSIGGIGSGPIGGGGQRCGYKCPDGTDAPQPNPPWISSNIPFLDVNRIIKAHRAFCVVGNHLTPQGPTSALVRPEEGDPDLSSPTEPNLIPKPPAPKQEDEAQEPGEAVQHDAPLPAAEPPAPDPGPDSPAPAAPHS